MNCPECGAINSACEERFHEFLALEYTDAGYGAVHHLTVTSYMLQHASKLTREGWLHMRKVLRELLVENKSPEFIRNQSKDFIDSGKRKFKFGTKNGEFVLNQVAWQRTILDIRSETSKIYCEDVTTWAGTVLNDAENLSIN
jgi:Family of unknown function (DUF5946)